MSASSTGTALLDEFECAVSSFGQARDRKSDPCLDFGATHLAMLQSLLSEGTTTTVSQHPASLRVTEDVIARIREFVGHRRECFRGNHLACEKQLEVSSTLAQMVSTGDSVQQQHQQQQRLDVTSEGGYTFRVVSTELLASNLAAQASLDSRAKMSGEVQQYAALVESIEMIIRGSSEPTAVRFVLPVSQEHVRSLLVFRLLTRLANTLKNSLAAVAAIDRVHHPVQPGVAAETHHRKTRVKS